MDCSIPHRHPGDCAAVWQRWAWRRDSCSSFILTYWCRGSQLEQTRCAVSHSRSVSEPLVYWSENGFTYKLAPNPWNSGGWFQADFIYIFQSAPHWEFNISRLFPWKSFFVQLCKDLRKKGNRSAQWHFKKAKETKLHKLGWFLQSIR